MLDSINGLRLINFTDLSIRQIGVWPISLRISLLLSVVVVIFLCAQFCILGDLRKQHRIAVENEFTLLQSYKMKAVQVANLVAYRQQTVDLMQVLSVIVTQLPEDTGMPSLLEDITKVAYSSGLSVKAIELKPEKVNELYIEMPIRLEVTGNYHAFGSFVSGIAALSRIVTLHDFTVEGNNELSLNMIIEARAYRYRSPAS